jgi:hypothetical protein
MHCYGNGNIMFYIFQQNKNIHGNELSFIITVYLKQKYFLITRQQFGYNMELTEA